MKKKIKVLWNTLLWMLAIAIGIFLFNCFIYMKEANAHSRWHEYEDIRFIRYLLQEKLDSYVNDKRTTAIADTDEKMRAYRSIDEIIETELRFFNETEGIQEEKPYEYCLERIFEGPEENEINWYEKLPIDENYCFEEEVVRTFERYIEPKENGRYLMDPKSKDFKDCRLWIWIQGSYEEGYTVMVLPDKNDPFSEVR